MNDAISTRKVSENTRLRLVFSLGIFSVEMTLIMFLLQHRDTQAIFYLSKWKYGYDIVFVLCTDDMI